MAAKTLPITFGFDMSQAVGYVVLEPEANDLLNSGKYHLELGGVMVGGEKIEVREIAIVLNPDEKESETVNLIKLAVDEASKDCIRMELGRG